MNTSTMICIGATILAVAGTLYTNVHQDHQISKLQERVSCLEHPHGESSVSATKVNGKWIVTKPTRTGC